LYHKRGDAMKAKGDFTENKNRRFLPFIAKYESRI
jgi:hypothetical protein